MYSELQGLDNLLSLFQLLNCHKEFCQTDDIHQISLIQQFHTLLFPFLLLAKERDWEWRTYKHTDGYTYSRIPPSMHL